MKKQQILVAAALLLSASPLLAQSSNNVDEVVKIERHAARDYREGEMIVKFKPSSTVRVRSLTRGVTSGVNAVDQVLGELGVTASEPLMPFTGAEVTPRAKALRSVTGKTIEDSDMSQLYRLTFDAAKVNVHEAVNKLVALDEVEYAEPNYIVYALAESEASETYDTAEEAAAYVAEPLYSQQWGPAAINLPQLWAQPKITTKRPVIAILDTGVDIEHPDLKDNIWTNEAELNGAEDEDDDANGFADDLHGWDFVNQTARLGDWNGHGTHCAGIAAAVGNNGIGVAGANPDALIMPVTVMQSDGTGDVATIIKGIDYAAANGADVISMSIGGYGYSLAEEQALAKAYSTAVLVAAAGNDYKCIYAHDCLVNNKNAMQNGPMYPAAFTFVLGVQASIDANGTLASFSNFDEDGPIMSSYSEEQLYNYELTAPGVDIMSTYPGGKYKSLNGTSMACPLVAGAISRYMQSKEMGSKEMLFGDLISTANGNLDIQAAFALTDADRTPTLQLVTYITDDTADGDGDSRPDAGETLAIYPTLRNAWGQAENIKFSVTLAENEDPEIVEILDAEAEFGKALSSYGKSISANPIRVKINEDCADGRHIRLMLTATCDNISETLQEDIMLTVENGVEIGGLITEDMTLYPNVHYIVTKTLAIQQGALLSIMPGTVIRMKEGTSIKAPQGTLECVGEPDNLIVFTMADNETGYIKQLYFEDRIEYVRFSGLNLSGYPSIYSPDLYNCIIENCFSDGVYLFDGNLTKSNIIGNSCTYNFFVQNYGNDIVCSNNIGNIFNVEFPNYYTSNFRSSNTFCNIIALGKEPTSDLMSIIYESSSPQLYTEMYPNYLGSSREDIVSNWILDMYHKKYPQGYGVYDLSNMLIRPSAEAHGIVWKVVVNGYDAQDEFEQLPPLGVGKHKFEVYFNRPMNKEVAPVIAMGVRPPYTSHAIVEDGSWNEEGTIYTAYLTITGKTGADGLNRIYVAGAEDDEYFEIPIENTRFNVEVAAAGSMATGLMAEAGLGKVSLTWETDKEDFADLLGYNIYRYTMDEAGVSSDSIIVNATVIDSEETSFVDYDVVPGTTYYYVIKQLTTSLTSHALSNAVAATPLTAQKGDANGSMNVDIADVVTEVAYITYQDPQPFIFEAADVNSDAKVNVLDVVGTIGIITTPAEVGVSGIDNEPVRYYVQDGVLYMENTQPLGGVQVRLGVAKGTAITALEALAGMEQTSVWTSEAEYLFLAYSMSGRSIPAGTHALLQIGDEATVTEMVLSDTKGKNITAVDGNATGIGKVEAVQLQMPSPNPFTTVLRVPYTIGKDGSHEVAISFSDLAGRTIDAYHTVNTPGEYTYTWHPKALAKGMYLVSLYLDGELMQTVKVVRE